MAADWSLIAFTARARRLSVGAEAPTAVHRSFTPAFQRDLDDLFAWRRDVRRFRSDPMDEALVARLFDAAGAAPSVGLSEPWRFVRVESAQARAAITRNFEQANAEALAVQSPDRVDLYASLKLAGLREAPVHIAVFCDETTKQGSGLGAMTMPEMRRYSVVCAVMQMWLSARAMGIGMGWVSVLDPVRVAKDLDTPPAWSLIAYLCLGWPEEEHIDCELERAGWETRRRTADRILKR